MAVTEIALLNVCEGSSIDDAGLRSKLAHAKGVMERYTSRSFYYFQQIEVPSKIYIIGEWDSFEQHMDDFIPGLENQAVLESLKGEVSVEWLQHIDVPHTDLPLPITETQKEQAFDGKLIWSIVRHWIKEGHRHSFQEAVDANTEKLQAFVTEGTLAGGWRIDKQDDDDEYVVLCPWKSVEQRSEFLLTDTAKQYGQLREHLDNAEAHHLRLLAI